MLVQKSSYAGVKLDFASNCTVEKCTINQTGGGLTNDASCGVISSNGRENRFINNRIQHVYSRGAPVAFGIYSTGKRDTFSKNWIANTMYGISIEKDSESILSFNRFTSVAKKIDLW
jgi:hypothetical protein